MLERGSLNRSTASTLMNEQSSRSHAIFTVFLEQVRAMWACGHYCPSHYCRCLRSRSAMARCLKLTLLFVSQRKKTGSAAARRLGAGPAGGSSGGGGAGGEEKKEDLTAGSSDEVLSSKFHFVDLAGERVSLRVHRVCRAVFGEKRVFPSRPPQLALCSTTHQLFSLLQALSA